jgi:hypothetical protein
MIERHGLEILRPSALGCEFAERLVAAVSEEALDRLDRRLPWTSHDGLPRSRRSERG